MTIPFPALLAQAGIAVRPVPHERPETIPCLEVERADWARAAGAARARNARLVALWAEEREDAAGLLLHAALARAGGYALLRTRLDPEAPAAASIAAHFIAASRMERHTADLFGIVFENAPDPRPWIRHGHWPEDAFPLRRDFDASRPLPAADAPRDYPFVRADSPGVHEIPVGPVHAGIIEPGHFRFLAVGERILNMEERLGYVHKGIERAMQGRDAMDGARLAARISGDSTVAHAWAFARACEHAAGIEPPPRAGLVRALLCERERIANHVGDIGAICNDAGFAFLHVQMQRLREELARLHREIFGHRLLFDTIVPGGVRVDADEAAQAALRGQTRAILAEVRRLRRIYEEHPGVQGRVQGSGAVSREDARDLGLVGFVARACGLACDVRADFPDFPYDTLPVQVCTAATGDVAARVQVRFDEIEVSGRLVEALLDRLAREDGPVRAPWTPPAPGAAGFAVVEGWRGEIACRVRFGEDGRIARCFVRDPSVVNWPGLELAVRTVPVPDFPLNNKSFNCSYAGNDL